jgi:hypothetical protein
VAGQPPRPAKEECALDANLNNLVTRAQRRTALMDRARCLHNQKRARWFRLVQSDACLLCRQPDGCSHIASGCRHPVMERVDTIMGAQFSVRHLQMTLRDQSNDGRRDRNERSYKPDAFLVSRSGQDHPSSSTPNPMTSGHTMESPRAMRSAQEQA